MIPASHQYAFSTNNQTRIRDILSDTNVDLLIITDDLFLFDAKRLANFRLSNDRLNTKVVTVNEIYLHTTEIRGREDYFAEGYEPPSEKESAAKMKTLNNVHINQAISLLKWCFIA